jgi:hypothetical protein
MRAWVVVIAACSGAPGATRAPNPPELGGKRAPVADEAPLDPIGALAPVPDQPVASLVPGRAQLELSGTTIDAPGGNRAIEVVVIDRHGSMVRAGVRLEHARFSVWSEASRLLGVLKREHELATIGPPTTMFVKLRPGARVRKLARKNKQTQVRYVGAVEVEGWIPDDDLGEIGPSQERNHRVPTGRRQLMLMPGAIIRVEPKWAAKQLALMAHASFIDVVKEIDDAWVEVAYTDREIDLRGYVSKRAPPGKVHRVRDPEVPPPAPAPNAKVTSGTCLYARRGGDPIGYVVGDRDVQLDDAGGGWWTLSLDSPWGALPFAAKGPTQTTLEACAPPGAISP